MADATKALIDETVGFVDRPQSKPGKPWQVWLDAELGFRDYWYPAALAQQLGEGATRSITLLGEDIMLTRQNGPDVELTMWRRFASQQARAVQRSDHARGYFPR